MCNPFRLNMCLTPVCFVLIFFTTFSRGGNGFDVVALGVSGGIQDGNVSAYMISPHNDSRSISCDAGTLTNGIKLAVAMGSFEDLDLVQSSPYTQVGQILRVHIKGYLLSHGHLDHVAGLIIASPDDSEKPIYALAPVLQIISDTYFNWQAWPNFTDQGAPPRLNKYKPTALLPGLPMAMQNTNMSVTAYPLQHNGAVSTAFLIESDGDVLLCLGDTGPDQVEEGNYLQALWLAVAEKLSTSTLKGIIIESSYPNSRPDEQLYGHLTPRHVINELTKLKELMASKNSLLAMPVIIGHIKYSLIKHEESKQQISKELQEANKLRVNFIIPEQGSRLHLNGRTDE